MLIIKKIMIMNSLNKKLKYNNQILIFSKLPNFQKYQKYWRYQSKRLLKIIIKMIIKEIMFKFKI